MILKKDGHSIGLRYTDFEDPYNPSIRDAVDEIIILSLQEPFSVEGCDPSTDETDNGILISWTCLKALFHDYFGLEYYLYTHFLEEEMQKTQEYIGIKSLQKLSPNYLFAFRQRVNSHVRNDIEELVGYQPIEDYNINRHSDLQEKSKELIYSSGRRETYLFEKYYKLLFGRSECYKSLVSSEFLRDQFPSDECFDFTAIVSGYLKSVEQLMYRIVRLSIGKGYRIKKVNSSEKIEFKEQNENKIDQTMGSLKYFFKDYQDQLLLVNDADAETFFWCLTLYGNECRNHCFHKNIIDDWRTVETIRKNTFFMYALLLSACKLGDTAEINATAFDLVDDRLEQLLLYLKDWDRDIKELHIRFHNEEDIRIKSIIQTGFPEYDDYGYFVNNQISFQSDDGNAPIVVSRNRFPEEIWYYDRMHQKKIISFV